MLDVFRSETRQEFWFLGVCRKSCRLSLLLILFKIIRLLDLHHILLLYIQPLGCFALMEIGKHHYAQLVLMEETHGVQKFLVHHLDVTVED